jgi:ATP phosphoribosyltransferase regulatory subunit
MTSPIARLASTRLREARLPQRLFYIANVFRYEEAQAGRRCEFYQAGVELLGTSSAAADAEIIALAAETLKKSGLADFKISMGHVGFLNGIVESTGLLSEQKDHIRRLLSRRDLAGLEQYMQEVGLQEPLCTCLREALFLHGGKEILGKASALSSNAQSSAALANLGEILDILESYKVASLIDFDLGMIRDFDYYTGMVFEGYTHGLGFPVCGGGRYDNMMASFGKNCPAIGFSAGVERLLLALRRGGLSFVADKGIYIAWQKGFLAKALELACSLRAEGKQVEVATQAGTRETSLFESEEIIYIES